MRGRKAAFLSFHFEPPIWSLVFHDADNPAGIQRPEPEMPHHDGHSGSDPYRWGRPAQPQPWDIEHLPCPHCTYRPVPRGAAIAKLDAGMVYGVAAGRAGGRRAHLG